MNKELEEISGVRGSKFCHDGLFLAVADTKESALELLNKALEN